MRVALTFFDTPHCAWYLSTRAQTFLYCTVSLSVTLWYLYIPCCVCCGHVTWYAWWAASLYDGPIPLDTVPFQGQASPARKHEEVTIVSEACKYSTQYNKLSRMMQVSCRCLMLSWLVVALFSKCHELISKFTPLTYAASPVATSSHRTGFVLHTLCLIVRIELLVTK